MEFEQLKLENQLCFPVYAASRLITREYQPLLDKLGITYPQYLVLMILWETDGVNVNDIAKKLILNTNTITPLLKRMEQMGIITRERSSSDERMVIVKLTDKGKEMRIHAASIPKELINRINSDKLDLNQLIELRNTLNTLINLLNEK